MNLGLILEIDIHLLQANTKVLRHNRQRRNILKRPAHLGEIGLEPDVSEKLLNSNLQFFGDCLNSKGIVLVKNRRQSRMAQKFTSFKASRASDIQHTNPLYCEFLHNRTPFLKLGGVKNSKNIY